MRMRQRMNVYGDGAYRMAKQALNRGACGRHLPELTESAAKWPKSDFRVLDGNVYVFQGKTLITAYPLGYRETA
jgi:hypothetical protein